MLNGLLGAVIETNPAALEIAGRRDEERWSGGVRSWLHGIPVLVKDNIATADAMQTTAGSLALVGSRVPADATVVARLREAGAVILGKSNLSEWANFRGGSEEAPPINGWSARGSFTRNPYVLSADPCGSSSGSGVSVAANLCTVAVGTETDGSITCPAAANNAVGLKPTVGLVSQDGIIPIAHSQDAAGPMTRTVADTAKLLGVLQSPAPAIGLDIPQDLPSEYTSFLRNGALAGARVGIDPQYFDAEKQGFGPEDASLIDISAALDALENAGATIVEDIDTGDFLEFFDAEFTVLLFEFKVQIAEYLATLHNTTQRTLADLIQFNIDHCGEELVYFGQEVFEAAEATSGDLSDPEYLEARALSLELTRGGLDAAFADHRLDAIIGPTWGFVGSPAAVAGYPHLTVPAGFDADGRPVGISFVGRAFDEGRLISLGYDFEQHTHFRRPPSFEGTVPPEPPLFDGCRPAPAALADGRGLVAAHLTTRSPWHRPGR